MFSQYYIKYKTIIAVICAFSFILNIHATEINNNNSSSHFKTDIEGINESMIYSDFWGKKLSDGNKSILSVNEIQQQNNQMFQSTDYMNDLGQHPKALNRQEILSKIKSISKVPSSNRYYANGQQLNKGDYSNYLKALNIKSIPKAQTIQFAMVINRANLRTFPTNDAVFKTDHEINLDRFQESAAFPAEAVAILHESKDEKWAFVTTYNYHAWIEKKHIAIGTFDEIMNYKKSPDFIVVTGDKVFTTHNPHDKDISEKQLDMGIKLQLVATKNIPISLDGQNTYTSYVINLPTRTPSGQLEFKQTLISRNKDVNVGFLDYTKENIIKQSFKFLGERYGWGHSFNARDCTGFVGDIYKSFGILMPRNSGQQATNNIGQNINFSQQASRDEKLKEIKKLEAGDLIYIPGHVMMYLGQQNGEPYIIHDVSGLSYLKKNGDYYKSTLNGVSVTPLKSLHLNQETSYIDRIYNLKKLK